MIIKRVRKSIFSILSIFIVIISFMLLMRVLENRKFNEINDEYPEVKFADSINGQVISLYKRNFGGYIPGQVYVTVKGYGNVQIFTDYSGIPDTILIDRLIQVGDFLVKYPSSDSIHLYDHHGERIARKKKSYLLRNWP